MRMPCNCEMIKEVTHEGINQIKETEVNIFTHRFDYSRLSRVYFHDSLVL